MSRSSNFGLHAQVTDLIITAIEQGEGTASPPWQRTGLANGLPVNAQTNAA
jgi:antirestriction protein ArdC